MHTHAHKLSILSLCDCHMTPQITAACMSPSTHPHLTSLARHHSYRTPRPPIHTSLANPFISERCSSDDCLLLLSQRGVNLHQDNVKLCQFRKDDSGVEQVVIRTTDKDQGQDFDEERCQTHTDTSDTVDQPTNTCDNIDQHTDTSDTLDQHTDTSDTLDQHTDTSDTLDQHTDTSDTLDQHTLTTDTTDLPSDSRFDQHTDTEQQLGMSGAPLLTSQHLTTIEPLFFSNHTPCYAPDITPGHTSDHTASHATSDHTSGHTSNIVSDHISGHTSDSGLGRTTHSSAAESDCFPILLPSPISHWSPTPPRSLSTPAQLTSPDDHDHPHYHTKLSLPRPHTASAATGIDRCPSPPPSQLLESKVTKSRVSPYSRWLEEEESLFFSPGGNSQVSEEGEEGEVRCEVWVASSEAHRSVLSVVGYCGHFTSLEVRTKSLSLSLSLSLSTLSPSTLSLQEIDMGDSPIMALCSARGRIWVGFELGYLLVLNSSTHHLLARSWLQQYKAVVSILHLPELERVFVTLASGSVYAYKDEVESNTDGRTPSLRPVSEYHDLGQPASCIVAVPCPMGEEGVVSHELWVGQAEAMITVLDPRDLRVVKFIRNMRDVSKTPSYMAYLTYTSLVWSSSSSDQQVRERGKFVVERGVYSVL